MTCLSCACLGGLNLSGRARSRPLKIIPISTLSHPACRPVLSRMKSHRLRRQFLFYKSELGVFSCAIPSFERVYDDYRHFSFAQNRPLACDGGCSPCICVAASAPGANQTTDWSRPLQQHHPICCSCDKGEPAFDPVLLHAILLTHSII